MKKIGFKILQKDIFLKFLSKMSNVRNEILLEFDLEKDLVIAKLGSIDGIVIRKDELKLSEVFRYIQKLNFDINKIKNGRILCLIADLDTLIKTINKFVTDGDVWVFEHENFIMVENRKSAKVKGIDSIVDVPSVDVDKVYIRTNGKVKATFTVLCGELKDFPYLSDTYVKELHNKDKYQFKVIFNENELEQLLDLCNAFSRVVENIKIEIKNKNVTFSNHSWEYSLNDSKVEGSEDIDIVIENRAIRELDVSTEFKEFNICNKLVSFSNENLTTLLLIAASESDDRR